MKADRTVESGEIILRPAAGILPLKETSSTDTFSAKEKPDNGPATKKQTLPEVP